MSANKENTPGEGRDTPDCNQPGPAEELPFFPEIEDGEQIEGLNEALNAAGIIEEDDFGDLELHPQSEEENNMMESSLEAEVPNIADYLNINFDHSEFNFPVSSEGSRLDRELYVDTSYNPDLNIDADAPREPLMLLLNVVVVSIFP